MSNQSSTYKVLVVDDDPVIRRILEAGLQNVGYEVIMAENGQEALTMVRIQRPNVIITDKMMPVMGGFEFIRRLRSLPEFVHLPVLILTSQSELEDKLSAFEAGADDYLPKPFEIAELQVRLGALLRRADALKMAQAGQLPDANRGHVIAVHSLRGGIGCSSLSVNLAVALKKLWGKSVLLSDMVLTAGQIALMLNMSPKRTWSDLTKYETDDLDATAVQTILSQHDSGLTCLLAPPDPVDAEKISTQLQSITLSLLSTRFDYLLFDLPHCFNEITLNTLDNADEIVLVLSPELASIRAASVALNTYRKLSYPEEKIKLVLNWTFEEGGLSSKKITEALKHSLDLVIPFAPRHFVGAINRGTPLTLSHPQDPISALLEDFAFRLSHPEDKETQPIKPSETWQRVHNRLHGDSKKKSKSSLWSFSLL